jgi:hypothetical protein
LSHTSVIPLFTANSQGVSHTVFINFSSSPALNLFARVDTSCAIFCFVLQDFSVFTAQGILAIAGTAHPITHPQIVHTACSHRVGSLASLPTKNAGVLLAPCTAHFKAPQATQAPLSFDTQAPQGKRKLHPRFVANSPVFCAKVSSFSGLTSFMSCFALCHTDLSLSASSFHPV